MNSKKIRTYSELKELKTFEERLKYLKLDGYVGAETFGFDRFINQNFYRSYEWKRLRSSIIVRDDGCDLGTKGYFIRNKIIIHHMNPIDVEDIMDMTTYLMNPEYLVCVSLDTHNVIHYGDCDLYLQSKEIITRKPNDTCPWR